jgi:hypothetical protein
MSSGWIQAVWIAGCLSNRVGAHTLSRRSRRNRHGAKIAMRALRVRGRQGGETVMVSSSEREPEPATTMTNVVRVLKQESRFLEERLLDLEQRLTNRKERERRTRAQHGWPVLARVRTGMRLPGCDHRPGSGSIFLSDRSGAAAAWIFSSLTRLSWLTNRFTVMD